MLADLFSIFHPGAAVADPDSLYYYLNTRPDTTGFVPASLGAMASSSAIVVAVPVLTHISALSASRNYLSNDTLRSRFDDSADVGYEGNVDYEKLAALSPDLVLLYGITSAFGAVGQQEHLLEIHRP